MPSAAFDSIYWSDGRNQQHSAIHHSIFILGIMKLPDTSFCKAMAKASLWLSVLATDLWPRRLQLHAPFCCLKVSLACNGFLSMLTQPSVYPIRRPFISFRFLPRLFKVSRKARLACWPSVQLLINAVISEAVWLRNLLKMRSPVFIFTRTWYLAAQLFPNDWSVEHLIVATTLSITLQIKIKWRQSSAAFGYLVALQTPRSCSSRWATEKAPPVLQYLYPHRQMTLLLS